MSTYFRIIEHRNSDTLHLKLVGDFDKDSALRVLEILNKYSEGISRIFIHTNALERIDNFDRHGFRSDIDSINKYFAKIHFTGEKAVSIAPAGSKIC